MAIYMKFVTKHAGIEGASTTKGLEKWIVVDSLRYGVNRPLTSRSRAALGREAGEVRISEIVVTKQMDKSSPKLWTEAAHGLLNSKVDFKFTTMVQNQVLTYCEIKLEGCGVSSHSTSAGSEGLPMESISVNFTKIVWSFSPIDEKGSGTPEKVGHDLATQQKV